MTIRTPYDSPYADAAFIDGTLLVSPVPWPGNAASPHTFYFSKRFAFAEGDYDIVVKADDACTLWVGQDALSTRMLLTSVLPDSAAVNVHIPQGEYRIDVIVKNMPAVDNPAFFALNILQGGQPVYLSTKDGWYLDDAPISDDDLPPLEDQRFHLPVFTVLPNWANGVTERLSWQTDLMDSESDAEQRRSVRRHPRRTFDAAFLRQGIARQWLDTFLVGIGKSEFLMPLWHEGTKLIDGLSFGATGVTFLDGNTAEREYHEGDLVLVNNGDPGDFDILQVGTVEEHRFSWAPPLPTRAWPAGVRIYPLRTARVLEDPKMDNVLTNVATADIRFALSEPDIRTPSWGASVNGEPVFPLKPDFTQPVAVSFSRKNYQIDNATGPISVTTTGRFTATLMQFRAVLFGRDNAYAFRQFLAAARGRSVHFQCPTFATDITPLGDIADGTTDLLIENIGYWAYMSSPQPVRLTMAFIFPDAPTIYRRILTGYEVYLIDVDGNVVIPHQITAEVLQIDAPLPAIALSDLTKISFIAETRFDMDEFELHHNTADQHSVELSLALRQAKNPRLELNP